MNPMIRKLLVVLEVTLMAFALIPFLALGFYRLFPGLEAWQESVGYPVSVLLYVLTILVVLLLILPRHKKPAEYGLDFRNLKYHLDVMPTCFIPVALVSVLFAMVDSNSWSGALILIVGQVALLLVLARLLRKKLSAGGTGILGSGVLLILALFLASGPIAGKIVVLFTRPPSADVYTVRVAAIQPDLSRAAHRDFSMPLEQRLAILAAQTSCRHAADIIPVPSGR